MTSPDAARVFLEAEAQALEPFDFVAVMPTGNPLHMLEITRLATAELEVRVPGRPLPLPEIEVAVRTQLRDRGFASKDASNSTLPWAKPVPDPAAAVELLQALLVEVHGEKPDTKLDVIHGSHFAEHEGQRRLAVARTRIEPIVKELLERAAEQDDDEDYVLPIGEVHVMVSPRAAPDGQVVIRIFAITNVAITVAPELGLFLARLNFGLMFGRFALDVENRSIWFDESILGEEFREEELRFAIRMVASTADEWDDRLKQMFGGTTYQEVLAGRAAGPRPPIKPGEHTGQYL